MQKRIFPPEFKEEAVRRTTEPGAIVSAIATELDINSTMLRRWMREQKKGHSETRIQRIPRTSPTAPPVPATRRTISSTEQELQEVIDQLREERRLLKKLIDLYIKD